MNIDIFADSVKFGGERSLTTQVRSPLWDIAPFLLADLTTGPATFSVGARYDYVRIPFENLLDPTADTVGIYKQFNPRLGVNVEVAPGAAVFAAAGLWMAWPAVRAPRHLHHVVGALAMVYMATAMVAAPGGHAGHGGTGVPVVTGALLLYFAGHVLLSGARLAPVGAVAAGGEGAPGGGGDRAACRAAEPRPDGAVGWADRPELVLVCRLAMSMGMLAMLVLMS